LFLRSLYDDITHIKISLSADKNKPLGLVFFFLFYCEF
jgi:hypothetical protein